MYTILCSCERDSINSFIHSLVHFIFRTFILICFLLSLLEHRRNDEIFEETKVEAIASVMRQRRLEWFGHVKRRGETENIRAVAEMKMEGTRPRGRPKLRWHDTVRRDLKAWNIKEEWATDIETDGKVSARPATPNRETAAKGEK